MGGPSKFSELPDLQDQFSPLAGIVATNLSFVKEVTALMDERAKLERDYARNLQGIVVKAQHKAQQMSELLVAGEAPSKHVREGASREHTLATAWHTILSQMDEEAYSRANYSETLQRDVCDALKTMTKRMEALRTKHVDFGATLVKERDAAYGLKAKAKSKYDSCCSDVESNRQKQGTAKNDRNAQKANKQYEDSMVEMWDAKNVYLLSIEVSNKMKDKYFQKDLPSMHDDMQALWTTIVNRFANIMIKHGDATKRQYEVLEKYNENSLRAVEDIDAGSDQALYVDYNRRPFFPPPEFTFEPCSIWHDNSDFAMQPQQKTFLVNKLQRANMDLEEVEPRVSSMNREVEKLQELRQAYMDNPALGDLDTVVENMFEAIRDKVSLETQRDTLKAEVDLLTETLGGHADDTGKAHDFKMSAFPVAKACYVCGGKIWGMSKAGLSCRDCNVNLHTGCELKCPADCGDPTLEAQKAASRASIIGAPSPSRLSFSDGPSLSRRTSQAPSLRSSMSGLSVNGSGGKSAKAVYSYEAQSGQQLSISAGETLNVEGPDNHGWTKVSGSAGTGIVPTSYIQISEGSPALSRRPTTASHRSASSSTSVSANGTVTCIYPYSAGSASELTVQKGDILELTAKGRDYAAGWTEVIQNGRKGIVPTSYIK